MPGNPSDNRSAEWARLRSEIESAYDAPDIATRLQSPALAASVEAVVDALDGGELRVLQPPADSGGEWILNDWAKKAILLYFRMRKMEPMSAGDIRFYDKVPLKHWSGSEGVRAVPGSIARRGAHIESGAILMPSFVNIGAFVGSGTMVDTWATVGSCAQIGRQVHLSGGVGIGGVLEPLQARPVVIEDFAFLGSRSIVVEGAHVESGAVLAAGVTITGSTKIIDVSGAEAKTYVGRVPRNAVVIPGTYEKKFVAGAYGVPCALIIGQRKESTNQKTSLTDALRDFDVAG